MVVKSAIGVLLIAVGMSPAFAGENRLTAEEAKEAAMASMRLIRGSSIDPNFDIRDVRNVDLDGDGLGHVRKSFGDRNRPDQCRRQQDEHVCGRACERVSRLHGRSLN